MNARESSIVRGTAGGYRRKKHDPATFWVMFTYRYPAIVTLSVLIVFLICHFEYNSFTSYLLAGGIMSLVAESLVIFSYLRFPTWRKHPSKLLVYRTWSNVVLSAVTVANAIRAQNQGDNGADNAECVSLSFITQLSFFAGECWLLMITVDLVVSLTNPFTSIDKNLKKYRVSNYTLFFSFYTDFDVQFLVAAISLASAIALVAMSNCQGIMADNVCWIEVTTSTSTCFWGFVLSWYDCN